MTLRAWTKIGQITVLTGALLALSACEDGKKPNFLKGGLFKGKDKTSQSSQASAPASSGKVVERDVEAPEVFQATDGGLWDGRPSLGGVWVAHADVAEPERAIIRNKANGKFVVGALFRRERENPGPKFQISSDAAEALGMLAGQPASLNVTALRKESVPVEAPAPNEQTLDAPESIAQSTLDPIASAAAAIDAADSKPAPSKPKASSSLTKPYIQLGIFSIKANAMDTATSMRTAGLIPVVKETNSRGKTIWRVLVGPATNKSERATVLKKIKSLGFNDANFVTD